MRRPSRRAVLGTALGVGLGTASGCLGTAGEPSAGVEPISLGTAQTLDGRSVTVSDVAVRDAVLYFETPESLAVASREGERYVVASVTSETGGPSADAFGLRVGGERYERPVEGVDFGRGADDVDAPYGPREGGLRGRVTFLVPVGIEAESARIVAEGAETAVGWTLDEASLAHLRRSRPTFEVASMEAPETVRVGESASVRVAVRNVSAVPGVFRGVFSVAGKRGSYALELPIRPGEMDRWKHTFRRVPTGWTGDVQFVLDSVVDGRQVLASTTVETASDAESRTASDSSGTDSPTSTPE